MFQPVLLAVVVVNVVTFLAFGIDKWRARSERRRIPEAWLLTLTFATGLVGAWIAMRTFRHKTRKTSFRLKMVAVSVVNVAWALVWLWWRSDFATS